MNGDDSLVTLILIVVNIYLILFGQISYLEYLYIKKKIRKSKETGKIVRKILNE